MLAQSTFGESPSTRIGIVGLTHGHADGFLEQIGHHPDVRLVGIVESDKAVAIRYQQKFNLAPNLFYSTIDEMVSSGHPQALLVYTPIAAHRRVIEQAARHHLTVMVEKPLTLTLDDALAIRRLARDQGIDVLVNYETTWYAANQAMEELIRQGKLGQLRKIVVHDGHEGPKEIGVPPEFLKWLTDPAQNGAGALYDFGCYGADLATRWMNGQTPLSVTAVAQTNKPDNYPRVDDDATIILQYPGTQVVIMPSWNWPFSRKDSEVYGTKGYAVSIGPDRLRIRYVGDAGETETGVAPIAPPRDDSLHYLVATLNGTIKSAGDLTSLDTNLVVMQILDAARESAKTGRTIKLKALPP